MDLILWRHAEAEELGEGMDDLTRALTPRGEKQAAKVAAWLDRQLPEGLRVIASPARRTEQTAAALGRKFKMRAELLPGGTAQDLLDSGPMAQRPGLDSHRGPSAYARAGDCAVAGHASARMRCAKGGGVVAAPAAAP